MATARDEARSERSFLDRITATPVQSGPEPAPPEPAPTEPPKEPTRRPSRPRRQEEAPRRLDALWAAGDLDRFLLDRPRERYGHLTSIQLPRYIDEGLTRLLGASPVRARRTLIVALLDAYLTDSGILPRPDED